MGLSFKTIHPTRETVTYDLDTVVDFGMFKGKTCKEILGYTEGARGASWLEWAHDKIPWFDITADLEEAIEDGLRDSPRDYYGFDLDDPYDGMFGFDQPY